MNRLDTTVGLTQEPPEHTEPPVRNDSQIRLGRPPHGRLRKRLVAALFVLAVGIAPTVVVADPAGAWPWSSTVKVWGTAASCGPSSTNGWGYFKSSSGEEGWVNFYNGSGSFTFRLNKVPTSGALVTLKWGVGTCSAARYFVISRPTYGDSASVGWLG